jgi:hypothetical protein
MPNATTARSNPRFTATELPAAGYPISEEAVQHWFRAQYDRTPTEHELGSIMNQMAQREATPPRRGPDASSHGWVTGPSPNRPRQS